MAYANANNSLNNKNKLQASDIASRTASSDTAKTVSNGWRNTGAHQLMSYSSCRTFRISNNFVQP
jgi:hypothetical protein